MVKVKPHFNQYSEIKSHRADINLHITILIRSEMTVNVFIRASLQTAEYAELPALHIFMWR